MPGQVASGKSVEASGRTVEQAVEAALARLGRSREQVEVQILRDASKGVLGFGAHDAIVRVTERGASPAGMAQPMAPLQRAPAPVLEADEGGDEEADDAAVGEVATFARRDELVDDYNDRAFERGTATPDELVEISREVLLEILSRMNILADVLATWSEAEDDRDEPALVLDIIGDDLGLLIGRRGETLRDLQYIVRLLVGHRIHGWANIVVDVEGYKQRREQTVRQLARRMADRAISSGRVVHMEPMSPYERRLVHVELRKIGGISTKSSGEGDMRRVGIYPAGADR